jgi:NAD(P)-dependent dehydrogenase (short-subunit alcohol dehydrogenase family)
MRNPQQVIAMVEETARLGGRLDFVVSNAAINPLMKWDETTLEDYDRIQEINLRGTWVVCQTAAKQMIKEGHGGSIVTISSISAWVSAKTQTVYCGTKAGIWMMTKALAQVLAPHQIASTRSWPGDLDRHELGIAGPGFVDARITKSVSPWGGSASQRDRQRGGLLIERRSQLRYQCRAAG